MTIKITPRESYFAYTRGWRDATSGMHGKDWIFFKDFKHLITAYNDGFVAGTRARHRADAVAAKKYKYNRGQV